MKKEEINRLHLLIVKKSLGISKHMKDSEVLALTKLEYITGIISKTI